MDATSLKKLKRKIVLVFGGSFVFLEGVFALTAGTFKYWQGWLFCAVTLGWALVVITYFLKRSPEFLARRMSFKEKEVTQKKIINVSAWIFFLSILITGLDQRFGWSQVPTWLVLVSDGIIAVCFYLVFLVFKENPYAARTVEVFPDQKLIDTGPYAIVRHPMYAVIIPMYLFMPVALGSYWAVLPFSTIILILIFRIFNEEAVLKRDLSGYTEYCKKVQYRLIPGVW